MTPTTIQPAATVWDPSTVESRFARRVTAMLSQSAAAAPHDVSERLRVARERALEKARWAAQAQVHAAPSHSGSSQAILRGTSGWGWRLASLLPVVAMVAGLILVQSQQADDQAHAVADIDAALLSDDLPPAAYADDGFAEFIRRPQP